ncbi:MAG TPA: hypothetical protein VF762_04930 [Blastocatellia bacterium]|jgi:hypothetical protein
MRRALLICLIAAASLGARSGAGAGAAAGSTQQQKGGIIEQIKASSGRRINADNSQGSPLYIQEATVKEISGEEFAKLVGEAPRHFRQATFPDVVLQNGSGKTIRSFALVARSAADTPDSGYILIKKNLSVAPGATFRVGSSEWPQADRVSVQREGKFVSGLRQPGLDSAKSWIPGASSDLGVTVGMIEFEDGTRWRISGESGW